MPRRSLPLIALFTTLLTGIVLNQTGWLDSRSAHAALPHQPSLTAADPYTSDAAWRYRCCQGDHWRTCLIHH